MLCLLPVLDEEKGTDRDRVHLFLCDWNMTWEMALVLTASLAPDEKE